jgi:hypothetical protein
MTTTYEEIRMRALLPLSLSMLVAVTLGCSISDSSGSFSESISSPSTSISGSSSGDDEPAAPPEAPQDTSSYRNDVSQLTVTFIKSGGEIDAFRSSVANLASARGLTDWEADADTTQSIGVGAGRAGLQEADFVDFSKRLVGEDLAKQNELRKGYQQTAPAPAAETAPETDGAMGAETEADAAPAGAPAADPAADSM